MSIRFRALLVPIAVCQIAPGLVQVSYSAQLTVAAATAGPPGLSRFAIPPTLRPDQCRNRIDVDRINID